MTQAGGSEIYSSQVNLAAGQMRPSGTGQRPPPISDAGRLSDIRQQLTMIAVRHREEWDEMIEIEARLLMVEDRVAGKERS